MVQILLYVLLAVLCCGGYYLIGRFGRTAWDHMNERQTR
jgi:hypothetical protein